MISHSSLSSPETLWCWNVRPAAGLPSLIGLAAIIPSALHSNARYAYLSPRHQYCCVAWRLYRRTHHVSKSPCRTLLLDRLTIICTVHILFFLLFCIQLFFQASSSPYTGRWGFGSTELVLLRNSRNNTEHNHDVDHIVLAVFTKNENKPNDRYH